VISHHPAIGAIHQGNARASLSGGIQGMTGEVEGIS